MSAEDMYVVERLISRAKHLENRAFAAESSLAAATELLRRWFEPVKPFNETRAFLAAQPAAPECRECNGLGLVGDAPDHGVMPCPECQPAAPSEAGRCVKCWCDECQCHPAAPEDK